MTGEERTPASSWVALVILSMAAWYAVIDKQVLILLAQPLRTDLGLSDTQIGGLQGAGAALFTAIAVVPLGWVSDRIDRRIVLAACVLVWSVAAAACAWATGYWSLLACVAFLAAGEAGLTPTVSAIVPDLVPERQRMTANFVLFGTVLVGAGAGFALAGVVVDHVQWFAQWAPEGLFGRETWRLAFLVVAIPGPLIALAIVSIRMKAPARTRVQTEATSAPNRRELLDYLASHWKAVAGVFVPSGLVTLGTSAIFTWLPVILARQFALSPGAVGGGFGAAVAAGTIVGLAGAAASASFLKSKWGDATPVRLCLMGYCVLAAMAPFYLFASSPTAIFVIAGIQTGAMIGGNSLMPTLLQDLAPARMRGRVFSLSTVIITVFQVISPIGVGLLSDHVFAQPDGLLLSSVALSATGFLIAAVLLAFAGKHVVRTATEVRAFNS